MKHINFLFALITMTLFYNCSYLNEDDLTEDVIIDGFVTYEANVKSIIDTNCISCHNSPPLNGVPMPLTTYTDVKDAVENRNLIGRISATDASLMPLNGDRLQQDVIDIIIEWEEEGLLEN